jgi:aspartate/methionine/tyrosine aminotransferase
MLERTVLLDGLSKTFSMTGWRCGFAAVPEPLVDPLTRFFTNSTSCVPPFIQHAGVAALHGPMDEVEAMMAEFGRRRELVVDGLNELPGVSCRRPRGAFYAFPNVRELPIDADELARRLLDEAGVAVLAGSAFGQVGKDHLRLSYANSQQNLTLALDRIGRFIEALLRPRVAEVMKGVGDLVEDCGVVDGGRDGVRVAVGDLAHRSAQDLPGSGFG